MRQQSSPWWDELTAHLESRQASESLSAWLVRPHPATRVLDIAVAHNTIPLPELPARE